MIFGAEAISNKTNGNLKNGAVWIGMFCLGLIGLCALDANLKIIECTICDDGIRKLSYSELNYGLILGLCALLSGLPSLLRLIKKEKTPLFNKENNGHA